MDLVTILPTHFIPYTDVMIILYTMRYHSYCCLVHTALCSGYYYIQKISLQHCLKHAVMTAAIRAAHG